MAQDSIAAPAEPAGLPVARRFRLPIALGALVAWVLITALTPFHGARSSSPIGGLTDGPFWGAVFAAAFLVVLVAFCRWGDLGLNRPIALGALLRLLWLPLVYLLVFLVLAVTLAAVAGPPPPATAGFLLLNTGSAAISEELMFRGVLFSALRTKLRPIWAIAITTVLFGLVHLLNFSVFGTLAGVQAVAAAMSGLLFVAIRIRTGSLFPAMVFHGLWDFSLATIAERGLALAKTAGTTASGLSGAGDISLAMMLVPLALLLPNFLYALFLLRRRSQDG